MSFLRFACLAVWSAWRHVLRNDGVLSRDRGRCSCPVCDALAENRHHLVFRSRGGGDEAENLIGICPLCHLEGVHRGRLVAEGTAGHVRWTIGRPPVMRVVGRERALM